MEALARQPREVDKNAGLSKFHLELRAGKYKTLNADSYAYSKTSPHFVPGKENVRSRPTVGDSEKRRTTGPGFERERSAPEGIGKVRPRGDKCSTMLHSRVASSLKQKESADAVSTSMMVDRAGDRAADKETMANESFTCGTLKRRETRSYSQVGKFGQKAKLKRGLAEGSYASNNGTTNKYGAGRPSSKHADSKLSYPEAYEKVRAEEERGHKQVDKIAVTLSLADNAKMGSGRGLVVTTNGSYINNLNINPVAFTQQVASLGKESNSAAKKPTTEKRDSECVEKASRLELELKKTMRESERATSGGPNKFGIYRTFFDEIIKADPYFGGLLREIQKAYEAKIGELNSLLAKQGDSYDAKQVELRKELEREHRLREETEKQRLLVLKEMKKQALFIESQKTVIKELKSQPEAKKDSATGSDSASSGKDRAYRTLQAHKAGPRRDVPPIVGLRQKCCVGNSSSSTRHAEGHNRERPTNVSMMVESKHVMVPKLDLSRIHKEESNSGAPPEPAAPAEEVKAPTTGGSNHESEEPSGHNEANYGKTLNEILGLENNAGGEGTPLDYNDEFMSKADEFSQSWKDALAREKRY